MNGDLPDYRADDGLASPAAMTVLVKQRQPNQGEHG